MPGINQSALHPHPEGREKEQKEGTVPPPTSSATLMEAQKAGGRSHMLTHVEGKKRERRGLALYTAHYTALETAATLETYGYALYAAEGPTLHTAGSLALYTARARRLALDTAPYLAGVAQCSTCRTTLRHARHATLPSALGRHLPEVGQPCLARSPGRRRRHLWEKPKGRGIILRWPTSLLGAQGTTPPGNPGARRPSQGSTYPTPSKPAT